MSTPSRNPWLFWGTAAAVVALDVVTKWLAVRYLSPPHVPHPVIGEFIRLTLAYNRGAAFSMSVGPYSRLVFGAFALVALVVLWNLYRRSHPTERLLSFALGLAWGGAAGNLIDRVRSERGVIDFIDIGAAGWRFWTFNVADSAVTVGAITLAWLLAREERRAHASAQRA
ncbi:MAG: signal peptidase II [Gemmatimonadaceae bacterium]